MYGNCSGIIGWREKNRSWIDEYSKYARSITFREMPVFLMDKKELRAVVAQLTEIIQKGREHGKA